MANKSIRYHLCLELAGSLNNHFSELCEENNKVLSTVSVQTNQCNSIRSFSLLSKEEIDSGWVNIISASAVEPQDDNYFLIYISVLL